MSQQVMGEAAPPPPATTPLGADRRDLEAVEAIVRAAGTSFHHGMRVLPPDRRHAMYAIYAFCRIVDDIADEDGEFAEKARRLDGWRARIAGLYQGAADGAVTRVLALATRRFGLRQADFIAVIDGMQTDAEAPVVAPTLEELDLYCDRVAAAVGRLSVRAFGDSSPAADRVAYALGRALQLTNILRDITEDAERGRIYLPGPWLDEAGVARDPATIVGAPGLPIVCRRVAALAEGYFRDAQAAMAECDKAAMKPARLMGATYAALLARLQKAGWKLPAARVSLPAWQKLWLALRYGLG